MPELLYSEQAKNDLLRIKRYIAKESGNSKVALAYTDRLRQQCRKLAELPAIMGSKRPELMAGMRSFAQGNYVILFRYTDHMMEVISIIEGHRDIEVLFRQ